MGYISNIPPTVGSFNSNGCFLNNDNKMSNGSNNFLRMYQGVRRHSNGDIAINPNRRVLQGSQISNKEQLLKAKMSSFNSNINAKFKLVEINAELDKSSGSKKFETANRIND